MSFALSEVTCQIFSCVELPFNVLYEASYISTSMCKFQRLSLLSVDHIFYLENSPWYEDFSYYKMPFSNNTLFLLIALVMEGCGIVLRNPAQVSCQL